MTDSIQVTKFDPKNPESFEYIPWYKLNKLPKKDRNKYERESEKWNAWKTAERIKREQEPREFPEGYRCTAREENKLILELGNALKAEGFEVVYTTGGYAAPESHTIHETWAQYGIVKKNGKKVGDFRVWMAGDWHAKPVGWKMETNRGKGSNPQSHSNEKRLKSVDSAVKYFNETAIPRESIEDELEKAEKEYSRLRSITVSTRNHAHRKKNGITRTYSRTESDGTMALVIDALETGNEELAMMHIKEQFKEYETLTAQVAEAEEAETDHLENVVKPLRALAKRAVPAVYS